MNRYTDQDIADLMGGHAPPSLAADRAQALGYGRVLLQRIRDHYGDQEALRVRLLAGVVPPEVNDIFRALVSR